MKRTNGMKNVDKQYPEILGYTWNWHSTLCTADGLRFAYSLFFACKTIYMLPIYRPRIHIVLSIKILRNDKIKWMQLQKYLLSNTLAHGHPFHLQNPPRGGWLVLAAAVLDPESISPRSNLNSFSRASIFCSCSWISETSSSSLEALSCSAESWSLTKWSSSVSSVFLLSTLASSCLRRRLCNCSWLSLSSIWFLSPLTTCAAVLLVSALLPGLSWSSSISNMTFLLEFAASDMGDMGAMPFVPASFICWNGTLDFRLALRA